MPSPWRAANCLQCGRAWKTRSLKARTCSPLCRAQLRESEHGRTRGRNPRDYPAELVERISSLYASGMTRAEVQSAIGPGVKVETVMRRYGIETRRAVRRLGLWSGENCPTWKGGAAGYQALHLRVEAVRGKPCHCSECGTTDPVKRYEWANLTGDYTDTADYARMCVLCHRRYDAARRARTGARTSPVRR